MRLSVFLLLFLAIWAARSVHRPVSGDPAGGWHFSEGPLHTATTVSFMALPIPGTGGEIGGHYDGDG